MINSRQNIRTFVALVNIFINNITDHKQSNQWKDTFEIVISAKDSRQLETNIQNIKFSVNIKSIVNEHYNKFRDWII
jgi:hypothetical protein